MSRTMSKADRKVAIAAARARRDAQAHPDVVTPIVIPPTMTALVTGTPLRSVSSQAPEVTAAQRDALLAKLRTLQAQGATRDADNARAQKRIRRALRLRGHRGGLSAERTLSPLV